MAGTSQESWKKSTLKSIKKSHNYKRGRGRMMAKKAFLLTKKRGRKSLLREDLNKMVQLHLIKWGCYNWFNVVSQGAPSPFFWPNSLYRIKMSAHPGASFRWLRECTCEALPQAQDKKLHTTMQRLLQATFALHKWMSHSHPYIHTYLIKLSLMSMVFPKHHPRIVATLE